MLQLNQVNELLKIIDSNQAVFCLKFFGPDFLTEYDKSLLESQGVDWNDVYTQEGDLLYSCFHFGMLSVALSDTKALNKFSFKDLKSYISQGKYIPTTTRDSEAIIHLKSNTLTTFYSNKSKIFEDVTRCLNTFSEQEEFIKEKLIEGVEKKTPQQKLISELGHKTGSWATNFKRIVATNLNSAYQYGRAQMFEKNFGNEILVYKKVFNSACKHCIKLYLTEGIGSEPIYFTISQLKANGTNEGKKVVEWKPTLGSTHPYCRCLLMKKEEEKIKLKRNPIRIKVSGKEINV